MLKLDEVRIRVHANEDLRHIKYFTEPMDFNETGFNTAITFYKEKSFKVGHYAKVKGLFTCISRGRYYMKDRLAYLEEELPVYYK